MAKINPVKLKQDADKAEKAGKFQDAISLLNQLVDDNSRDWNTIKKIGDLYARMNRNRDACEQYAKVADFYAKDGFLLKSIAIWKQIQKLDPAALEPSVNLADLYSKQGLMMEAKSQYQTVVDEYIKRGKTREAGEALRKLADLDPSDLKVRSKLADLYMREGSKEKALDEHVAIAEELTRKGHLNEALQVLEKGLKLDPKSVKLRGEIARIHVVQRNFEKAAQVLEEVVREAPKDTQLLFRLGEAYVGGKKLSEAESIFKRLLEIDPNDQDSRVQMGRVCLLQGNPDGAFEQFLPVVEKLLGRKEGDKAVTLLQQITQQRAGHIKTLAKLADVYKALKKDIPLTQAYSQLTEAYTQAGQYDKAAEVLEILVAMEPQNGQYRSKLEFVRGKSGAGIPVAASEDEEVDFESQAPAPATPGPSFSTLAPEEDVAAAEIEAAPAAPAPGRAVVELSGSLTDEDKEFIDEHLAEGKVFRKYGLVDKAADQFEAVVARFPDHLEARQELRDVYKEKGQKDRAAEQCHALAEIHRLKGDAAAAAAFEAEARELSPAAAPAARAVARPAAAPAILPEPEVEEAPAIALSEPEVATVEVEEDISLEVEETAEVEEGGIEAAPASEEPPALELGLEDEGGAIAPHFIEEEPVAVEAEAEAAPEVSLAPEPEEEISFVAPEPAAPPPLRPAPPPTAAPPPSAPGLPADLQKVLGEVEEYVSLGFVDDAREALREVLGRYPNHPAILEKTQSLGLSLEEPAPETPLELPGPAVEEAPALDLSGLAAPEPAPPPLADLAPAPAAAVPEGGLDLGAELDSLFGAQAAVEEPAPQAGGSSLGDAGLEEIFKEFKKGVDKQLGKEDYDTRYNLGIAYKEMGLIDEAIAEFQLAAKDEARLLECASMLGICFMDKGMPKLAMKWFEKGLETPNRRDEEYQALRYDLASAHEAAGDTQQALSLYTELYGQDANFRDVASKLRELRAASR
ncbi:MAG TPA: tetratricopeptide repeat protein [Vicinamibacteria bacterium]|nr:tetratricopeptide repeat protein [Vicinamibacteria bacterium]